MTPEQFMPILTHAEGASTGEGLADASPRMMRDVADASYG